MHERDNKNNLANGSDDFFNKNSQNLINSMNPQN